MGDKKRVLILCTGNSARSQMAEAFLRKYHGDRVDARSAGTDPAPRVNPLAVRAMQEIGINIATARPKDLTEFLNNPRVRDVLIVCDNANQTCPRSWRGDFTRTFMPFDDPAAARGAEDEQLAVFRRIRDEIGRAMREWKPTPEGATR
jgi:arsenate reductase